MCTLFAAILEDCGMEIERGGIATGARSQEPRRELCGFQLCAIRGSKRPWNEGGVERCGHRYTLTPAVALHAVESKAAVGTGEVLVRHLSFEVCTQHRRYTARSHTVRSDVEWHSVGRKQ